MDKIPDHSTFSQNRRRRFGNTQIFRDIFNTIVVKCIESGLVSGERVVSDGSFIPANVSFDSRVEVTDVVEKSTVDYLDLLEAELRNTEGFTEAVPVLPWNNLRLRAAPIRNAVIFIRNVKKAWDILRK